MPARKHSQLRVKRLLAGLSLRAVAKRAGISGPLLSLIERHLHKPSDRALEGLARAYGMRVSTVRRMVAE